MAAAAIEVLPGRLYYSPVALRRSVSGAAVLALPADTAREVYVSIEEFCLYYPFFLDFGPAALNRLIRFCGTLRKLLSEGPAAGLNSRRVNLVTGTHMHRRANATYLIAGYLLLELGFSPEEALKPFAGASPPIAPWHDASPGVDPFHLTTLDVLRGIKRARDFGFFSYEDFDVDTYEKYEQVINGDMNWLVQGRFLAFAGPHDPGAKGTDVEEGYHVTTVQDLLPPFINFGIAGVVRLNKKYYDERLFVHVGIKHADLYFLDGSNPPEAILQRFLLLCEETEGAIAVHCKAGLGRTGSCIGAYLMKHYGFTAREVIGWMRVCRPGSVIGPQQQYLESIQARMWEEGAIFRRSKRLPMPVPGCPLARKQMNDSTQLLISRPSLKPSLLPSSPVAYSSLPRSNVAPSSTAALARNLVAGSRVSSSAASAMEAAEGSGSTTQGDLLRQAKLRGTSPQTAPLGIGALARK